MVSIVYQRRIQAANAGLSDANGRLGVEIENVKRARDSEARIRYFNNVLMAEREWNANNVRRAKRYSINASPSRAMPI